MDLLTIIVIAVIVIAGIVLGVFIVYMEIKGLPYRKSQRRPDSESSDHFEQDNNELLPTMTAALMYEMLRQQEAQHHSMTDITQPETPAIHDDDGLWNM
jgi:hypothetical protein